MDPSNSNENGLAEEEPIRLMEENRVEMTFLEATFSSEEVNPFQEAYKKRSGGRTNFLRTYP